MGRSLQGDPMARALQASLLDESNVALALARRSLGIAVLGVSLLRIRLRTARHDASHSAVILT
jgi:hypothetical protein